MTPNKIGFFPKFLGVRRWRSQPGPPPLQDNQWHHDKIPSMPLHHRHHQSSHPWLALLTCWWGGGGDRGPNQPPPTQSMATCHRGPGCDDGGPPGPRPARRLRRERRRAHQLLRVCDAAAVPALGRGGGWLGFVPALPPPTNRPVSVSGVFCRLRMSLSQTVKGRYLPLCRKLPIISNPPFTGFF